MIWISNFFSQNTGGQMAADQEDNRKEGAGGEGDLSLGERMKPTTLRNTLRDRNEVCSPRYRGFFTFRSSGDSRLRVILLKRTW
jgi:hypothetical protein